MTARVAVLIAGILGSAVGAVATWIAFGNPPDRLQLTIPSPSAMSSDEVLKRLDEVVRQLARIEPKLPHVVHDPTVATDIVPSATRTDDYRIIRELSQQLTTLGEELRNRTAGLGELQTQKPMPDFASLTALHEQIGSDWRRLQSHVLGMTYVDVVRHYGTPTEKFPPISTQRVKRSEQWLWEPVGADFDFRIGFSTDGVATDASFSSAGSTRKFLEETAKE